MIYLDNASTTQIDPRVLQAMMPYLTEEYGNPGTLYGLGRRARKAISEARTKVADFIGAKPEQIIFTSGGSEANNLAIYGLEKSVFSKKRYIITSEIEHDSLLKAVERTKENCDLYVIYLAPNEAGYVEPCFVEEVINKYDGEVGLVSIMHTNNETGVSNDVEAIGRICHSHKVLFHTDCVQAAGCFPLNVNKIGCDFLSISSHKVHGAKGIGALYVRDRKWLNPLILGGNFQEFGLRGGTENVAGIVGFGEACKIAQELLYSIEGTLKFTFLDTLIKEIGSSGFHTNGKWNSGKTTSVYFEGVDAETLLLMLDSQGVCVSAGSACRSHENEPSRVLVAMGISPEVARNSIRISVSRMNTKEEMVKAAKIIADCVKILRNQH